MLSRFQSPLAESLRKGSECKAFPYPGHQAQRRVGVHVPTAPSLQAHSVAFLRRQLPPCPCTAWRWRKDVIPSGSHEGSLNTCLTPHSHQPPQVSQSPFLCPPLLPFSVATSKPVSTLAWSQVYCKFYSSTTRWSGSREGEDSPASS